MPQLDVVSYLMHYLWVLFALLLLFFLVVLGFLPILQEQFLLRIWAEKGKKRNNFVNEESSILILRSLLN